MASLRSHNSLVPYGTRSDSTVPAPVGIQDGDQLRIVLMIGAPGTAPTPTLAGWTENTTSPYPMSQDVGGFQVVIRLYEKAASGESGDYTFNHASANTTAWIGAVQGATTGLSQVSGDDDAGASPVAPSVDPVNPGALIIFWALSANFLGAVTPPSGSTPTFTERLDAANSILYIATGEMATAGPTGTKTVTISEAPSMAGMIVVEAPAAPPSGTGGIGSRFDDWF